MKLVLIKVISTYNLISSNLDISIGGLVNEWLLLVVKNLLDVNKGLFQLGSGKVLQLSPISSLVVENQKYYKLFGRLIGYVIY